MSKELKLQFVPCNISIPPHISLTVDGESRGGVELYVDGWYTDGMTFEEAFLIGVERGISAANQTLRVWDISPHPVPWGKSNK